jgi:hypothetical protein
LGHTSKRVGRWPEEEDMKSRPVAFNFTDVSTFWAENKEFALIYNGA